MEIDHSHNNARFSVLFRAAFQVRKKQIPFATLTRNSIRFYFVFILSLSIAVLSISYRMRANFEVLYYLCVCVFLILFRAAFGTLL